MLAHEFGLASPGAVGYFGDDPEFALVVLSGLAFAVYLQLPGAPEKKRNRCPWWYVRGCASSLAVLPCLGRRLLFGENCSVEGAQ